MNTRLYRCDPSRVVAVLFPRRYGFRGRRFAPTPANGWHPSGVLCREDSDEWSIVSYDEAFVVFSDDDDLADFGFGLLADKDAVLDAGDVVSPWAGTGGQRDRGTWGQRDSETGGQEDLGKDFLWLRRGG